MKYKPLYIGQQNDTHEDVVRDYMGTLPDLPGDRFSYYRKGEFWGDWIVNDVAVKVTLVSVGPADWRFAVFADGPEFKV